jgi:hypothetical protein
MSNSIFLPGFWDQISPSVLGFSDALSRRLNPNIYADEELKKMVQNDPNFISKMADAPPETQAVMAETIGFKGKNPFANLKPSSKKILDESIIKAGLGAVAADPEGVGANTVGGRTSNQKASEDLSLKQAELQLAATEYNNEVTKQTLAFGKLKLDQAEEDWTTQQELKAQFNLKDINLGKVADDIMMGKEVPAPLVKRINDDPALRQAINDYQTTRLARIDQSLRREAMGMQRGANNSDNTKFILSTYQDIYNGMINTANRKTAELQKYLADNKMADMDLERARKAMPDVVNRIESMMKEINDLNNNAEAMFKSRIEMSNQVLGLNIPTFNNNQNELPPLPIDPQTNKPITEKQLEDFRKMTLDAVNQGKVTREEAAAKFKAATGRDL